MFLSNKHSNLSLFDLDGTLLPLDTNHEFGNYLADRGWVDAATWRVQNDLFLDDHYHGRLDLHRYIDFATAAWRDRAEMEVIDVRSAFMKDVIVPAIPAAARSLIAQHREAGDLLALVTGTNEFLATPIAQELGIEHVLAVQLEREAAGRVTGRIFGIPSFHAGKVDRVHEWLAAANLRFHEFESVTYYGDSVNDLPLLEAATNPVAVNPSLSLRNIAQQRGWQIIERLFP